MFSLEPSAMRIWVPATKHSISLVLSPRKLVVNGEEETEVEERINPAATKQRLLEILMHLLLHSLRMRAGALEDVQFVFSTKLMYISRYTVLTPELVFVLDSLPSANI